MSGGPGHPWTGGLYPRRPPERTRSDPLTGAGILCGLLILTFCGFNAPNAIDFISFYESGRDFRQGGSGYGAVGPGILPNLNPPTATIGLFAPLSRLPRPVAGYLLFVLNLIALAATMRLVQRALELTAADVKKLVAVMAVIFPLFLLWFYGQFTWILLYFTTRAWIESRNGRPGRAGAWLAPVIACKPFLAIATIGLGGRLCLTALIGSASLAAATLLPRGLEPWRAWNETVNALNWLTNPTSISLWSWVARVDGLGPVTPLTLRDLGRYAPAVLLLALPLIYGAWRTRGDPDRAWVANGAGSIFVTPAGWVFYLLLFFGPVVSVLRGRPIAFAVVIGLAVPVLVLKALQAPGLIFATVGSLWFFSAVAIWIAAVIPASSRHKSNSQAQRHG